MPFTTEEVEHYLEQIEGTTLEDWVQERQEKMDELSSLDQLLVTSIVAGFYTASNKDAYLRAIAMALVRSERKQHDWPLRLQ